MCITDVLVADVLNVFSDVFSTLCGSIHLLFQVVDVHIVGLQ